MPSVGSTRSVRSSGRPVADVDADDAADVGLDPGQHLGVVPDVVGVEQDPDLRRTGDRQHPVGLGEAVDEARHLPLAPVHRLEADPGSGLAGDGAEALERADEQIRSLRERAVAERAGEAGDALGVVGGEPPHRCLERRDALGDVGRAFHAGDRERQHRRDLGHAHRDAEAVLGEQRQVRLVVGRQLELPDPDRVEPGGGVGLDVLGERGADRRDLREREAHERPGSFARSRCVIGGFVSSFATR